MTEAEIIASSTAYTQVSATATAIYLSLVSGYLVVAYIAGRNLDKAQLLVINTLFFVTALWHAFASAFYGELGAEMGSRIAPEAGGYAASIIFWGWFIILSFGVLASFYFMYKTRQRA